MSWGRKWHPFGKMAQWQNGQIHLTWPLFYPLEWVKQSPSYLYKSFLLFTSLLFTLKYEPLPALYSWSSKDKLPRWQLSHPVKKTHQLASPPCQAFIFKMCWCAGCCENNGAHRGLGRDGIKAQKGKKKCWDVSLRKIRESEFIIYLTATSSIPPWSDMPHPAHGTHTHIHTKNTYSYTSSLSSIICLQSGCPAEWYTVHWLSRRRFFVHTVISFLLLCLLTVFLLVRHTYTNICICMCTSRYKQTFVVLVSQVLVNKESQAPCSLAKLIPVVHMLSSSTVTQHCSCTILSARKKKRKTQAVHLFSALSIIFSVQYDSALKCSPLKSARGEPDGDLRVVTLKMHGWVGWVSPVWIHWKFIVFCNADITGFKLGWAALPEASILLF